jgi:hypothetical protein
VPVRNITIPALSRSLTLRHGHPSQPRSSSRYCCFRSHLSDAFTGATRGGEKDSVSIPAQEPSGATPMHCTLMKPISWLFSRKHCRQMLRPYFRIRPALWVQTRLLRGEVNKDHHVSGRIPVGSRDRPWVGLEQTGKPERGKIRAIHTIREIPCRRFVGVSTRLHRATS